VLVELVEVHLARAAALVWGHWYVLRAEGHHHEGARPDRFRSRAQRATTSPSHCVRSAPPSVIEAAPSVKGRKRVYHAVSSVSFSPDGRTLATASFFDGAVRLWEGILWRDFSELRARVCGLVWGDLTRDEWARFAPSVPYDTTCAG